MRCKYKDGGERPAKYLQRWGVVWVGILERIAQPKREGPHPNNPPAPNHSSGKSPASSRAQIPS